MDIQLKKGILDICVLSILNKQDSYGYQIFKDISKYMKISESTLYPILRRMEASNALSTYSVEYNGRLRKYYSITDIGRIKIREFLDEWKELIRIYEMIDKEVNI